MTTKRITLAYCRDNQHIAKEVDRNLSRVDYEFQHMTCSKDGTEGNLSERLRQTSNPVILLISDNFLKSAQCMYDLLTTVQDLIRVGRIKPVITDGIYRDEQSGALQTVATTFDRVSNVIQYMNYWQDKYLEVRREKRQSTPEEEEELNERLKVIRSISSEIGEFLRFLRNMEYTTYPQFKANDYEQFFRFTDDSPAHSSLRSLPSQEEEPEDSTPANPTADTHFPFENETILNVPDIEEDDFEEDDDEEEMDAELEEEFDVSTIPGMDLIYNGIKHEEIPAPEEEEETLDFSLEEEVPLEEGHVPVQQEESFGVKPEQAGEEQPVTSLVDTLESEPEEEHSDEQPGDPSPAFVRPENDTDVLNFGDQDDDDDDDDEWEEETQAENKISEEEILEEVTGLLESEDADDGMERLAEAIEEHPGLVNLRYQYAVALIQHRQRLDEAQSQLEILLNYDPNYEKAYLLLGELAEHKQDFSLARSYYEQVASLNEAYPGINYRLGMLLLSNFEGEEKKALRYLKKAVQQEPENVDAHYQYAILLDEHAGKHWKAIKHFKKALKLKPDHPFANYDLAVIYHRLGDKYKAYKHYQRAIQINSEVKTDQNDKAFAYELIDETEEVGVLAETTDTRLEELQKDIRRLEQLILKHEELTGHTTNDSHLLDSVGEEEVLATTPPLKVDKTVFITGATSGIGRATAKLFAENGYRLILNGRRQERLEDVQREFVEKYKADVLLLPFDVRDVSAVKAAIDTLEDEWKQVDILINNAGLASGLSAIHEGDLEDWETMIDTNLKGLLYMTRAISPHMVERRSGHIINLCSTAGKEVYPKGNVYNATKFAVDALTQAMRLDLHAYNIRVSQVAPGHVEETEFAKVRFHGDEERAKIYEDFQPLRAADVAEVIYFIATRPAHVNIQDVLMMGTQQASNIFIDRSGRPE